MNRPRFFQRVRRALREHMTLKRTLMGELREARASADELLQLHAMAHDRRRQVEGERDLYFTQWKREQQEHEAARAEIESLRKWIALTARPLSRTGSIL